MWIDNIKTGGGNLNQFTPDLIDLGHAVLSSKGSNEPNEKI